MASMIHYEEINPIYRPLIEMTFLVTNMNRPENRFREKHELKPNRIWPVRLDLGVFLLVFGRTKPNQTKPKSKIEKT